MSPFSSSSSFDLAPNPIARELDAGERILWSGSPDPARMRRKGIPAALFSIPMGAFMAFWIWGASSAARAALAAGQTPPLGAIAFPAFGLIFVVVVVAMALSPWAEAAKARRTFYAITDRRALVVIDGKKKTVRSVLPAEFALERRELARGGDVILRVDTTGTGSDKTTTEVGFFGIENPQEVERLLRDLARSAR